MKETVIAKRYAEAFVAYGQETIGLDRVVGDFKKLGRTIHDNPDFKVFLESPEITYSEKCRFVDEVLKEGFSEELRQFIKMLIDKRRINLITDVAEYIRDNYAHGEAVSALLKTSYPLDLDIITTIKERLEQKFQKKFNLYLELDASLNGGVEVTIGNTIIDGSLRRRLQDLRELLIKSRIE